MARIYPFRALRYDPARVDMEDVVTQPYDKITPAMQERYYEASPYNLVRVILGKRFAADTEEENVYTRAAETLHDWRRDGILKEESEPALYGYSQTYTVPHSDEVRERRGFIALGHLYDYADKVVYRHEQTFPKHKSDRMSLFKATRAYCEQIYMLYSDPAFTAEKLIFGVKGPNGFDSNAPDLEITDEYGVVHRVWKLTDPNLINLIVTAMADKKLIIADGHHRYETSVAYAKERSAQLKLPFNKSSEDDDDASPSVIADSTTHPYLPVPAFPEAAMMMTFVNMDAPGITILPTHRVVHGIENFSSPDFITKASYYFNVKELDDTFKPNDATTLLASTPGTAFVAATIDGSYLLTAKPDVINAELKDVPSRQRQLEVVHLHRIILDKLLGLDQETITRLGSVSYIREAEEAVSMVTEGDSNIAFLIKPITLEQLKEVSFAGDVMPQKSTDFYPKLLSGLAIYALD
jgi:uncharacterized protein (DUF1015 family)